MRFDRSIHVDVVTSFGARAGKGCLHAESQWLSVLSSDIKRWNRQRSGMLGFQAKGPEQFGTGPTVDDVHRGRALRAKQAEVRRERTEVRLRCAVVPRHFHIER